MGYTALICARSGSKGVVNKNVRLLAGRPLIGWAIQTALQVERISTVIVSTDSVQIARIALEQGAEVPFIRPAVLAKDDSPEWEVWRHALYFLEKDRGTRLENLVVIPPTAPLRKIEDIDACLDTYEQGDVDIVITVTDAHRSPFFNMVISDEHGYARLVIPPQKKVIRRQDAPVVYDMTTVAYVVDSRLIMEHDSIFDGRVKTVQIPIERSLDIDTEFDIKIADFLLRENKDQME